MGHGEGADHLREPPASLPYYSLLGVPNEEPDVVSRVLPRRSAHDLVSPRTEAATLSLLSPGAVGGAGRFLVAVWQHERRERVSSG